MPKLYFDVQQGTPAWYRLRSGIPTASEFSQIITPKKMELSASRRKYACRLLAERLLNWQAESLDRISHIEEGKAQEPFAVAQLEEIYEIETKRIGFATSNDGRFGASPDRVVMVGDAVGITVEAKCPTIPVQFERLLYGTGDEYRMQILGQLWITEADKAIFYSYSPRMPAFRAEMGRDEVAIKQVETALNFFSDELDEMTERARRLGAFQAFASLLSPAEAEYGSGHYNPPSDADIQDMIDGRGHALA